MHQAYKTASMYFIQVCLWLKLASFHHFIKTQAYTCIMNFFFGLADLGPKTKKPVKLWYLVLQICLNFLHKSWIKQEKETSKFNINSICSEIYLFTHWIFSLVILFDMGRQSSQSCVGLLPRFLKIQCNLRLKSKLRKQLIVPLHNQNNMTNLSQWNLQDAIIGINV